MTQSLQCQSDSDAGLSLNIFSVTFLPSAMKRKTEQKKEEVEEEEEESSVTGHKIY